MSKTAQRELAVFGVLLLIGILAGFTQIGKAPGVTGGNGTGGSGTVGANNGVAGALATYAAASGSTTVGPDSGLTSNATGTLTLGAVGVGTGLTTYAGSTSGSINWGCNAAACTTFQTATPIQTTANSGMAMKHLGQIAANNFAGSCTMVSGTCNVTINLTYTTPLCFASYVSGTLTGFPKAALSATTMTLSSTVGTDTAVLAGFCMGNPT
jgi:hypothetical protein